MKPPKVIAGFAMTVDGKISTRNRTPSLFTSSEDKEELLRIRALGDAVMVGRKTLMTDTMSLGLPNVDLQKQRQERGQPPFPLRVIVSGSGNLNCKAKVFQSPGGRIVIFSHKDCPKDFLEMQEVDWVMNRQSTLRELILYLRVEYAVKTLVCEGGPSLLKNLVEEDLVDELRVTIAPLIFGGVNAPTLLGLPGDFLPNPVKFRIASVRTHGDECFIKFQRSRRTIHNH
jgi:riboflavin-specific deaminase-like protein